MLSLKNILLKNHFSINVILNLQESFHMHVYVLDIFNCSNHVNDSPSEMIPPLRGDRVQYRGNPPKNSLLFYNLLFYSESNLIYTVYKP